MKNTLADHLINELNHKQLLRKQQSITRLFPTFHRRVEKVISKGGIRMVDMNKNSWTFKLHSGTDDSKWYKGTILFRNVEKQLKELMTNKKLWSKDKEKINLNKLADTAIDKFDIQLECSCPAFLYYGSAYILTGRDAKVPPPETRAPKIRNPKQYGAMCKHLHTLFRAYPFYRSTMANWLKTYYIKDIDDILKGMKATPSPVKKEEVKDLKKDVKKKAPEKPEPEKKKEEVKDLKKDVKKKAPEKPEPEKKKEEKIQEGLEDIFQPPTEEELDKRKLEQKLEFIKKIRSQGAYENPDGTWSSNRRIAINSLNLTEIPVQFKVVLGDFDCSFNSLKSLKGCPEKVSGRFTCFVNKITSLKGCPKEVGSHFSCRANQLTSLKDGPVSVGGNFYCSDNHLISLEGMPSNVKRIFCGHNAASEKRLLATIKFSKIREGLEDIFQPPTEEELDKRMTGPFMEMIKNQGAYKNPDGTWSSKGDISISDSGLVRVPVQFKEVKGSFNCRDNELTSLKGCPEIVGGNFDCGHNQLTTLEGGPKIVGGGYLCNNNKLTSLKGSPRILAGSFCCYVNKLKTLEGGPELVGGEFSCSMNQLTSLKGCPRQIGRSLQCNNNKLKTLAGSLERVGRTIYCHDNPVPEKKLLATIGYSKLQESLEDIFQPPSEEVVHNAIRMEVIDRIKEQGAYENEDGSWSSKKTIDIASMSLHKFPIRFKEVGGSFMCDGNELTSLEGSPEKIGEHFSCEDNNLASLESCSTKEVGGNFLCGWNYLTSLKGCPEKINGIIFCRSNTASVDELLATIGKKREYVQQLGR